MCDFLGGCLPTRLTYMPAYVCNYTMNIFFFSLDLYYVNNMGYQDFALTEHCFFKTHRTHKAVEYLLYTETQIHSVKAIRTTH